MGFRVWGGYRMWGFVDVLEVQEVAQRYSGGNKRVQREYLMRETGGSVYAQHTVCPAANSLCTT